METTNEQNPQSITIDFPMYRTGELDTFFELLGKHQPSDLLRRVSKPVKVPGSTISTLFKYSQKVQVIDPMFFLKSMNSYIKDYVYKYRDLERKLILSRILISIATIVNRQLYMGDSDMAQKNFLYENLTELVLLDDHRLIIPLILEHLTKR